MEDEKKLSFADRVVPMRKSRRHSKRIPEVGSPTDFKHLLHIGTDSHHVDISNVPPQWKDILEIAKHCHELDISSNSSAESENCKKDSPQKDQTQTSPAPVEEEFDFKSEIDLFADLERSLSDDYKKFLFG